MGKLRSVYCLEEKCQGDRYDFIRFIEVKYIRALESQLDQIRIRETKMLVNIPRYQKQHWSKAEITGSEMIQKHKCKEETSGSGRAQIQLGKSLEDKNKDEQKGGHGRNVDGIQWNQLANRRNTHVNEGRWRKGKQR